MKYAALAAIALAVVVCRAAEPAPPLIPDNDNLIDKLIDNLQELLPSDKAGQEIQPSDKDVLRELLENLNKRLALAGVTAGLKDIVGKEYPDAKTFEDYRAALFKELLPNNPSGMLYNLPYNLGLDVVDVDLSTYGLSAQKFFGKAV